ncbi:MAG: hypothetical protein CMG59_04025 [Candidatus Marinimicrobia bacterium]|nr:hypothetical protein [Candidatus Neomarinimicrobiota bacterium]|tara:strand:- start:1746 stop:1937 length:192 start_codon:yes stop_codon:yes gene_type:complete
MKITEKAKQLAVVVWINLFIGFYNLYIFRQDSTNINLVIGILNIGIWVFLRTHQMRVEYLKER